MNLSVLDHFDYLLFASINLGILRYSFVSNVLALAGPAYIVCPLQGCVKDSLVYNCAKLILCVFYKGHILLK